MKKQTIPATDFQRKPYAQPQIKVVEIESAELLCGSGDGDGASTQSLDEEEFNWNNEPTLKSSIF